MRRITLLLPLLITAATAADKPSSGIQPAQVDNARLESDLTTLTLTPKAEQRLGIQLEPVEKKTIDRTRVYGGEIVLPLSGIYKAFPNLTPAEMVALANQQIDADTQIKRSTIELEASQVVYNRTESLVKDNAGIEKDLEDARATVQLAQAALEAAQAKRAILGNSPLDAIGDSPLWVRVAVYSGDLPRLKTDADAQIGNLADRPGSPKISAPRIAVPTTTAGANTTDLYFAITENTAAFKPGQRVGVTLPLNESGESLTVPWNAVITDINGGTWVYKNTAPQTYQRHRVQVTYVAGDTAAIASGPDPGTKVATDGVAELFGTEFGTGK